MYTQKSPQIRVNSVENVDGEDMQLHMLTFDTELDNTVSVQKGGSRIDKFSMELKAFHNEEDGQYWCGEFETDEVDRKLAELIVNIQYACQRYYFGAMAEAYFDNKLKDASVNVQRRQKTYEAFSRLPEEFVTIIR